MKDDLFSAAPLGKVSEAAEDYSPSLLYAIPRIAARDRIGLPVGDLPFTGIDVWTLYEISWLDGGGKPHNAIGQLQVPAESEFLIESKSLKLYLGSLNQAVFDSPEDVAEIIKRDVGRALSSTVELLLYQGANPQALAPTVLPGECLDGVALETSQYQPDSNLLQVSGAAVDEELLYSDLFRSQCPVTGQPDWASVCIAYRGRSIDHTSLLKYLVSYRKHAGFHEQCVEQIFVDILERCEPELLTVYARFLRRGGIEINPYRTNARVLPLLRRLIRQ